MTHSKNSSLLNFFIWLERIEHFFLKMIQRIESFLKMTQRIEPFSQNDSKFLFFGFDSYFWLWLLECYCFVYVDSNNWTVFWIRLKGLNFFEWLIWPKGLFFSHIIHRIEHFFLNTTERIEHSEYDSKNWTTFFLRMTQKLELCLEYDSMDWTFFQFDSKNWTFFQYDSRIEPFLSLKRIEPSSFSWRKELNPFFRRLNWTLSVLIHRIEHSFWTRLTELNSFFRMWLKELNRIFKNLTQRIEHSSLGHKELNPLHKMTQWIEPFCEHDSQKLFWITTQRIFSHKICLTKLKELNLLFTNVSKNWTFWKTWLTELNMSHRNWTFLFYMTQRIELFLTWLKELNFFEYWLKELNLFLGYDGKIDPSLLNFDTNQRIEPLQKWLKEFNFLLELSQRVKLLFFFFLKKCLEEIFFNWLQNWTF